MAIDVRKVREQFPALGLLDEGQVAVHLDNPAGTQVPRQVVDRMTRALVRSNANFGGNFRTTRDATEISAAAHLAMADLLNAPSEREIVFGPNMTTLTFMLSRSLGPRFREGDEIILGRMEHDANVTPWRLMAEERGLVVRVLEFDPGSCRYDLSLLDALLSSRTRFAAMSLASNLTGTVNDAGTFCRKVRAAGALSFIDAVHYAPHGPIDVQALGCDVLACSPYKFFGPHQGVLWAREALLEELRPYKLRASADALPGRFETGTPSLEGQAGTLGAIEYLEWVGTTMGQDIATRIDGMTGRRRTLHAAMTSIAEYEQALSARLIGNLGALPGVRIHGITDRTLLRHRVPTVSISKAGVDPDAWDQALASQGICAWSGHSYAVDVVQRLGLADAGGVLRIGAVHYNTGEEMDIAAEAVASFAGRSARP
ncbi:MAG TPA: cysteine desulfurase-like protein [Steroidobacteraceae bacterium]|nr:cysteine desulfurase-like protein [Steroidobacteraceae bacterium]